MICLMMTILTIILTSLWGVICGIALDELFKKYQKWRKNKGQSK